MLDIKAFYNYEFHLLDTLYVLSQLASSCGSSTSTVFAYSKAYLLSATLKIALSIFPFVIIIFDGVRTIVDEFSIIEEEYDGFGEEGNLSNFTRF